MSYGHGFSEEGVETHLSFSEQPVEVSDEGVVDPCRQNVVARSTNV